MSPLFLMVAGSVLVGFLGRHRRIGFLGFFLLSMVITPLLGLLVLILSADERIGKRVA
jgi:hypothetical protein